MSRIVLLAEGLQNGPALLENPHNLVTLGAGGIAHPLPCEARKTHSELFQLDAHARGDEPVNYMLQTLTRHEFQLEGF